MLFGSRENILTEMASVRSWREARAVETRWYSDSVSSNTVCHCCKGNFTVLVKIT